MQDIINTLRTEIGELEIQLAEAEQRFKDLLADEDPSVGRFHAEKIFANRQDKLRLQAEVDIRERRIRRIEYGMEGAEG